MSLNELFKVLNARQITLWKEGDKLKFKAPSGALDNDVKQALKQHKATLLNHLSEADTAPHPIEKLMQFANTPEPQLSFAQKRMLFMQQLKPESFAFNMPVCLAVTGELNQSALIKSVQKLTAEHSVLRTLFENKQGVFSPNIQAAVDFEVQFEDFSGRPKAQAQQCANQLVEQLVHTPFDLDTQLPLKVSLLRISEQEHWLLLLLHHVACDGWSQQLILAQIAQNYDAYITASEGSGANPSAAQSDADAASLSYFDYASWQQNCLQSDSTFQQQLKFWTENLKDAPPYIGLPTDKPRPTVQDLAGGLVVKSVENTFKNELEQYCASKQITPSSFFLAALYLLLARHTDNEEMVLGITSSNRPHLALEKLCGPFLNTLPIRINQLSTLSANELLTSVHRAVLKAQENQDVPFEQIVEALHSERELSHTPIFQVLYNYQRRDDIESVDSVLDWHRLDVNTQVSKYDLSFSVAHSQDKLDLAIEYATALYEETSVQQLLAHYLECMQWLLVADSKPLNGFALADNEHDNATKNNLTLTPAFDNKDTLSQRLAFLAQQSPGKIALIDGDLEWDYQTLWQRVNQIAHALQAAGIGHNNKVAVRMERGNDLVAALFATLHLGAAYIPVDPGYPIKRQRYIIENAGTDAILTTSCLHGDLADKKTAVVMTDTIESQTLCCPVAEISAQQLAYIIYTSGTTGLPKGVMVSQGNLQHFLHSLDNTLGMEQEQTWLAVTSVSFDISVLELLWTVSRGSKVVLQHSIPAASQEAQATDMDFSLIYFASAGQDLGYEMLLEGAKFADQKQMKAVWIPERHFHDFGGQYANPSVAAAAVAATTQKVHIRSGSVVAPLHHPARIAEEWAMVDKLSNGRVGLSIASGWHFNDFVFAPELYENRHQVMKERLEQVRALWRGDAISMVTGNGSVMDVKTMPRPVQKELPVWVTAAMNVETFKYAGSIGAGLLTHLLGQSIEELAEKIKAYRQAREEHGFDPDSGCVTLMLHTFIGDSVADVKKQVEAPFKNYLRSSVNLLKPVAESAGIATNAEDDTLVEIGFQRYFASSALFGTPDTCLSTVDKLHQAGVNEIACLVDFGVEHDTVLRHLSYIRRLMDKVAMRKRQAQRVTRQLEKYIPPEVQILKHQISHLQCTPSYLSLQLKCAEVSNAIAELKTLCLGGEQLPENLVQAVQQLDGPSLLNMYGPTETTVWSSISPVESNTHLSPPVQGEHIYILDKHGNKVPVGVPGDIFIGGMGVTLGYLDKPDLTASRFVVDPFSSEPGTRMYFTGDRGKWLNCGDIKFLGRSDYQVKIRGHRIELPEIEAALLTSPDVDEAGVVVSEDAAANIQAYVSLSATGQFDGSAIKQILAEQLPDYMMPAHIILLDELPRTPNGKIDRKKLPKEIKNTRQKKRVKPSHEIEQKLHDMWQNILKVEDISIEDNFFDLGGNSFLLAELHSKIESHFAQTFPLIELFKQTTIAAQSGFLQQKRSKTPTLPKQQTRQNRPNQSAVIRRRNKLREIRENG